MTVGRVVQVGRPHRVIAVNEKMSRRSLLLQLKYGKPLLK
jgi:hypothetical protein